MRIEEICPVITFSPIQDDRGSMIVIEGEKTIPFEIKRLFYIYNVSEDAIRGQHANNNSDFLFINVSGTCMIRVTNAREEMTVPLNEPGKGLFVPRMIWKEMYGFSKDAVLLIVSNSHYDSNEYIRDYHEYEMIMNN